MRVGVAGLGFMGKVHLNAYAQLEGVQLQAVCADSERALAGDLSVTGGNIVAENAQFDLTGVRRYLEWEELVADRSLDIVDICLPTWLHGQVAIAALRNGKDVLCEKPMALSAHDCDDMLRASEHTGRILMIGQVLRFWPEYVYARKFVQDGEWGEVRSSTFVRHCGLPDWSNWLTDENRGGGAILDLLVHDIDQAVMLFGLPRRIAAKQVGAWDAIMATLLYDNGPEVRIQGGWFASGTPLAMGYRLQTARAELEWSEGVLTRSDEGGQRRRILIDARNAYAEEIAYFVRCCRERSNPELCPPGASAVAVKLALLLKESRARGGEQIKCLV